MTAHRTISGIPFTIHSPSLYTISGAAHLSSWIDLCTVSLNASREWHINVLMKQGHSIHRGPFASLAEAVALIAGQTRGVA